MIRGKNEGVGTEPSKGKTVTGHGRRQKKKSVKPLAQAAAVVMINWVERKIKVDGGSGLFLSPGARI